MNDDSGFFTFVGLGIALGVGLWHGGYVVESLLRAVFG